MGIDKITLVNQNPSGVASSACLIEDLCRFTLSRNHAAASMTATRTSSLRRVIYPKLAVGTAMVDCTWCGPLSDGRTSKSKIAVGM